MYPQQNRYNYSYRKAPLRSFALTNEVATVGGNMAKKNLLINSRLVNQKLPVTK